MYVLLFQITYVSINTKLNTYVKKVAIQIIAATVSGDGKSSETSSEKKREKRVMFSFSKKVTKICQNLHWI